MTCRLKSFPRLAALSVAITLLIQPTAGAQTPASAPAVSAPTQTHLLGTQAFKRLVHEPWIHGDRIPLVTDSPQDGLFQAITATTRRILASPAPKSGTAASSRVARPKSIASFLLGLAVVVGLAAALALFCSYGSKDVACGT